jgi:tetratricopeptide (TPR) repeat protein
MRLSMRALVALSSLCLTSCPVLAQEPQCEKALKDSDISGIERYCTHLKVSNNIAWKRTYYFLLGLAQFQKSGQSSASPLLGRALENVSTAIAIDTKSLDADMYMTRGLIYLASKAPGEVISGNASKAVKDFSVAISLKPRDPRSYYYRGLAYNQLLNPNAAWADFQKAKALDPSNREIQSAWQKQRQIMPEGRAVIRKTLGPTARASEVGTCTARIRDIRNESGETTIVIHAGQGCATEAIVLRSRPSPPECVAGATVTAKGTYVESSELFFPVIELDFVTEIACR